MTKKDPEDLTPEERRVILERAGERLRRQLENELIAKELEREEQEEQQRAGA